jgi:peptidoglycan/LPS O-acetylase OafA/YrhL
LFGVVLSYYNHFNHTAFVAFVARKSWTILSLSCALIAPCFFYNHLSFFTLTVGFTLLYLGFGGLLVVSLYGELNLPGFIDRLWKPIERILAYIGYYSYSIYLWHVIIATWGILFARRLLNQTLDYRLEFVLYSVASIAAGILMAWLVEQPVLRLRNRYFPARSDAIEGSKAQETLRVALMSNTSDLSVNWPTSVSQQVGEPISK